MITLDADLNTLLRFASVRPTYEEFETMTVCVAALSDDRQNVVGASDRMLTTGDGASQFEPLQSKIIDLTTSIVIQWAGDSPLQSEIVGKVRGAVRERVRTDPANWWLVEDVAALFQHHFLDIKARRSSNTYLRPIGLDTASFLTRNLELQSSLVTQLTSELISYQCPTIAAIIAGVDPTGAHLFVVSNSGLYCMDSAGFAAIGVGASHANPQFMFSRYSPNLSFPDALFLAYTAKKRGEAASGVGSETDMYAIIGLGGRSELDQPTLDKLRSSYEQIVQDETKAFENARGDYYEFVQKLISETIAKKQAESAIGQENNENGASPSNEGGIRSESDES